MECDRIRELRKQGVSSSKIADRLDRHQSTVFVHANGECAHASASRHAIHATEPAIGTAIKQLADELQEVPAKRTWEQWEGRLCSIDTVVDRLGSWEEALNAAGLPVIADNAPKTIRKAAYRQPELTLSTND